MDISKKKIIKNIVKTMDNHPPLPIGYLSGKKGTAYQHLGISKFNFIKTLSMFKESHLLKVVDNLNKDRWESDIVIMSCENDMFRRMNIHRDTLNDFDFRVYKAHKQYTAI